MNVVDSKAVIHTDIEVFSAIKVVRDELLMLGLPLDDHARRQLAGKLSEAMKEWEAFRASLVAPSSDDFEDIDPEASSLDWPTFPATGSWEETPDDVLGMELPALSGGAPSEDWESLAAQIMFDSRVADIYDGREIAGALTEDDVRIATGAY